jgi:hypothetical protein
MHVSWTNVYTRNTTTAQRVQKLSEEGCRIQFLKSTPYGVRFFFGS